MPAAEVCWGRHFARRRTWPLRCVAVKMVAQMAISMGYWGAIMVVNHQNMSKFGVQSFQTAGTRAFTEMSGALSTHPTHPPANPASLKHSKSGRGVSPPTIEESSLTSQIKGWISQLTHPYAFGVSLGSKPKCNWWGFERQKTPIGIEGCWRPNTPFFSSMGKIPRRFTCSFGPWRGYHLLGLYNKNHSNIMGF